MFIVIGIIMCVFGGLYIANANKLAEARAKVSNNTFSIKTYVIAGIIIIICGIVTLFAGISIAGISGGSTSSSSDQVYTCGYCGKEMKGGYYDYINGNYACRSCSKKYRDR